MAAADEGVSPPDAKRARTDETGAMPPELREKIEKSLAAIGQVEYKRRPHRKGPGPVQARCLLPEDLVHEKEETIRSGLASRPHYKCSNPKCTEPLRKDKWDSHILKMTSDLHLQETAADVLERSMNFAPDGQWIDKESRMQRVVTFMQQRHFLSLARSFGETDLAKRITEQNRFLIRLTNMIRENDPTSKTLLAHFAQHYKHDGASDGLADLLLNIVFVRNTMSKEVVKMCETGLLPWLTVDKDCCVSVTSKEAIDGVFLQLGGKIFFQHVEPMKSRSKCPRRGYGELASELVAFARKARDLAALWRGPSPVETIAAAIRQISGFGGKGFRCKEIVLDLAAASGVEGIEDQLVDFGVVGPGPRRVLNFINNRWWFDNEQDGSPAAEAMYVSELREFRAYLQNNTDLEELKGLHVLGVQFGLCEAWIRGWISVLCVWPLIVCVCWEV